MATLTIDKNNFEANVINSEKPVLVEFWAPWCTYCRRIAPVMEKLGETEGEVKIAQVNIDDSPELADKYAVEVIPTMFVFKNGIPGERIVAPGSKAQIEEFIQAQK